MTSAHEVRRERLRERIAAVDGEAALLTNLVHVRYLCGFTGSNAALLVTAMGAVLATDRRYTTQARAEAPDVDLLVERRCAVALARRAVGDGVGRLAFEAQHVTVEQFESLKAAADLRWTPLGRAVESLRAVKDETELRLLREACAIGDVALAGLLPGVRPGRTELDIARELEARMFEAGAEATAFSTIVASGPHSAIPHHAPTDRPLDAGDLLKIDFGARHQGYHADMTRTFVVGAQPAAWQAELHALVAAAQAAGRAALTPGAALADVDRAAREVIADAGHAEHFPHGLGHGVGLEIHEAPMLARDAAGILGDRTPVTVEPGVYLPGRGGVRIEDTLVVRDAGHGGPELLTKTARELLVLG